MQKNNTIAIILARQNSKRIPGKNYKKFNGKPIISITINKLKESKIFDRIIVSTDSSKIAKIAKRSGAEVPFIRPKSLAGQFSSGVSVMSHSMKYLIEEKYKFKYACCVYAPNPLLHVQDLRKGLKKIASNKFNYVFSATPYLFPFFRSFTFSKKKGVKMLFKENYKKRSQDLMQIMCDAGQFYWADKKTWIKEKVIFSSKSDIITVPKWRYQDIDTLEDWKRAEIIAKTIY
jgi:pseudaminic acid cytidylyltransferase